MRNLLLATALSVLLLTSAALAGETPSAAGAKVYFINLKDGGTVSSPVKVIFGLSGMGVAPAGMEKENTGHHHLLVDRPPLGRGEDGEEEFDFSLPEDENHLHFGKGQTETQLKLKPGTHTFQLVLGDANHIPHRPVVASPVITITVK